MILAHLRTLCIFGLLSSCRGGGENALEEYILPKDKQCQYIFLSHELERQYETLIRSRHPIRGGSVGGAMMDDIREVSFHFTYIEENLTIAQARAIMVDCMQQYLEMYNRNEKIRPYLSQYPFDLSNFHMILAYRIPKDRIDGWGQYVQLLNNHGTQIYYSTKKNCDALYHSIHKETYEEALAELEKTKNLAVGSK